MGERQEVHDEVLVCERQSPNVASKCGIVHAVSQHDTFTDACRAACIKNIREVVLLHFRSQLLNLFAVVFSIGESQELIEIKAHVVLWIFLDRRVEDDEPSHVMLDFKYAVGSVVLILLTDEDVMNLGITHHVLHLHLRSRCIERDSDGSDAVGAEVHEHTFGHVLRESCDVFLYADTQFEQRSRDATHGLGKAFPRNLLPLLQFVVAIKHGGSLAVNVSLTLD